MPLDDEVLIKLVSERPILYNPSEHQYKTVPIRDAIWEEIGTVLAQPGSECKRRWRCLRDSYMRANSSLKMTKFGKVPRKWKYEKEMKFLTPFVTNKVLQAQREQERERMIKIECADQSELEQIDTTPPSLISYKSLSPSILQQPATSTSTIPHTKEGLDECFSIEGNMDKQPIPTIDDPSADEWDTMTSKESDVDIFFRSMAETVKTLPLIYQANLKLEVCKLITEAQLKFLHSNDTLQTQQSNDVYRWPSIGS